MWTEEEEVVMEHPAFKGFLAHVQEGKDVPTSDVDDGQRYALRLRTAAKRITLRQIEICKRPYKFDLHRTVMIHTHTHTHTGIHNG